MLFYFVKLVRLTAKNVWASEVKNGSQKCWFVLNLARKYQCLALLLLLPCMLQELCNVGYLGGPKLGCFL